MRIPPRPGVVPSNDTDYVAGEYSNGVWASKIQAVKYKLTSTGSNGTVSDERVERFWSESVGATGIDGAHTAWGFGDTPELLTELGLLGQGRAEAGDREPQVVVQG